MGDIYHIAVNCYFILHLKPSQQWQSSRLLSKTVPELFPDILCMTFPLLKIQPVIISFKQSHAQSVVCVCVCAWPFSPSEITNWNKDTEQRWSIRIQRGEAPSRGRAQSNTQGPLSTVQCAVLFKPGLASCS